MKRSEILGAYCGSCKASDQGARETAGRVFRQTPRAERWIVPLSGWVLVAPGVWMCLRHTLRVI